MLELALLGLLKEQAMHGYELKRQLNSKLGHFWQVSFGSLYPTLKRLEKRGAVERDTRGDGTSRRKNVYRITDQGEDEFLELIEDRASTAWEEDKFPLRLAFFRYLAPEMRIRLLERRRIYLEDKLSDLKRSLADASERIDTYTLSLLKHGMDNTASDIAWLDELLATERGEMAAAAAAEAATTTQLSATAPTAPEPTSGDAPRPSGRAVGTAAPRGATTTK